MSRRSLGFGLIVVGGLMAVIGLVGMLTSDDDTGLTTSPTTIGGRATTSSTSAPTTSATLAPTTSASSSTTTSSTTTTVTDLTSEIEAFVPQFADAITRGDIDFLYDSLHPAVLDLFSEELCRDFIEAEILLLVEYRLTGPVTGPVDVTLGESRIATYEGPVAFRFQGQDFNSVSTFAFQDGVRWFTECR